MYETASPGRAAVAAHAVQKKNAPRASSFAGSVSVRAGTAYSGRPSAKTSA